MSIGQHLSLFTIPFSPFNFWACITYNSGMPDFDLPNKIHFVGVGGVSMSALALFCLKKGVAVTGSDRGYSSYYESVLEAGGDVWLGEDAKRMPKDALVVYSSAIDGNNLELTEARRIGQQVVERLDFLARVESLFCTSVAVAGTHGKTTVTSMLDNVFRYADMHYTAHIGGIPMGHSNLNYNGEEVFLTEACEYRKSLLKLRPHYAIVTNIEFDHPDTYKDMTELYDTFRAFCTKDSLRYVVMPTQLKYAHIDIFNYAHIITFGNEGDCVLESVFETAGGYECRIRYKDREPFWIRLNVKGLHNVQNALSAVTLCCAMGISIDAIKQGIETFRGVERRFENKGKLNGAPVYVDYAHHPSEIKAAIATARDMTKGNLYVVFQPHTYSRTKSLYDDFVSSFFGADVLFVTSCFSAREGREKGLSALDLYRGINQKSMFCTYHEKLLPIAQNLVKNVKKDDFVLILGAGDVDNLAKIILA